MTQAFNLSQLANHVNSSGELDASNGLSGLITITNGGTGASTAATAFDNLKQSCSDTYSGVVELATAAEAAAGTDNTRAITPATIKSALNATGSAPIYAVRAFVAIAGASTITSSGNVSSVADLGAGAWGITFSVAMPYSSYGIGTTGEGYTGGINGALQGPSIYDVSSTGFSMAAASNTNSRGGDWYQVEAIVAC